MTEVAANLPPPSIGGAVLSVRHFEAGPPPNIVAELEADPENSLATTKEEEWVTKKKVELTTKRQIETRVKRQVVLEDGKVVEDSGPIVTTNTTEDTEKQEHNQNERRTLGDDPPEGDWHPVAGPTGLVKEVKERVVKSREEKEELVETEDIRHLGDISDEGYMKAVQSGSRDGRLALETTCRDLVDSGPRVVHQSTRNRKIVDTEDKQEVQERQADGRLVTETRKTVQREEIDDADLSDENQSKGASDDEETHKESSHHYRKTKDQDLTEYLVNGVKVGQKLRYQAESAEGQRMGDPTELDRLESLSERIRKMRLRSQHKLAIDGGPERKDALTKKPLDFDQEEATRKKETSKWLEHHFGSESTKSSKDSLDEVDAAPATQNSFINVTMTSRPIRSPRPLPSSDDEKPTTKVEPRREIFVSSPELCDSPTNNGYFRGVSDWSSRRLEEKRVTPPESPPLLITSHRINPVPLKQPILRREHVRSPTNGWKEERRESPIRRTYATPSPDAGDGPSPSPPMRRKHKEAVNGYRKVDYDFRSWDRRQQRNEPKPDYTPPPQESPSPLHEDSTSKKFYQRTRFAADIPPVPPTIPRPIPVKQKSKITDTIRKFVGKLSSGDRGKKKRGKSSRSPSPSYSPFGYVDNNIPYAGRGVGAPVAPPRGRSVGAGARDMAVQKYYLGEDPFSGSIYGREREYDGVVPLKSSRRGNLRVDDFQTSTLGRLSKSTSRLVNEEPHSGRYNSYDRGGVQTLPRKLKTENSVKRQVEAQRSLGDIKTSSPHHWERPKPSKLSNSLMNVSFSNQTSTKQTNGILNGPAKPARTYRSNILRSKSFNVQTGSEYRDKFVSNPQLHSLEESPPPLRSPGIISGLNRSSRDITEEGFNFPSADEKRKAFMKGLMNRAPELYKSLHGDDDRADKVGTPLGSSTPLRDPQKRMVNYSNSFRSTSTNDSNQIRSPMFYKHFQNDKDRVMSSSPTYQVSQDANTTKSVVRRGSDDDYSETVRITSRSDDPLRPSETNTVKTFSKKVVPTKNGLSRETIQSEETKTVVKSRFGGDGEQSRGRYGSGDYESRSRNNSVDFDGKAPHSVVIEVRSPGLKNSRRGT